MGTKYSTVSVTSYNASPPADDGTQDASNQLNWSKHKEKLGDPLKTAVDSINANLVDVLNEEILSKTDTYTTTAADHKKTVLATVTSAGADIILLDAATGGSGYIVTVANDSTSSDNITVKLSTSTDVLDGITNGSRTIHIGQAQTFIVRATPNGYITKQSRGDGVVLPYGAGGDGVVDDTTALQNALDGLESGDTLLLNRNYKLTSTGLTLTNKSRVRITGKGKLALSGADTAGAMIIKLAGTCDDVEIDSITLVGDNYDSADANQHGIGNASGQTLSRIRVHDVNISNINVGIGFTGVSGSCTKLQIHGNDLTNIVGTGSGQGYGITVDTCPQSRIYSNTVDDCDRHSIYIARGNHVKAYNNTILNHRKDVADLTFRAALSIARGSYIDASNNTFIDCYDSQVGIEHVTSDSAGCSNVQLHGNKFINRKNAVPAVYIGEQLAPSGFMTDNVDIFDNYFYDDYDNSAVTSALIVNNGTNIKIHHNKFNTENASTGARHITLGNLAYIVADADCQNNEVLDNVHVFEGSTLTDTRAIVVDSDLTSSGAAVNIVGRGTFVGTSTPVAFDGTKNNPSFVYEHPSGARIGTYVAGDTTPTVANNVSRLYITNSGSTTISDLDNGESYQTIELVFGDNNTVINGAAFITAGGAPFSPTANDSIVFQAQSTSWIELSRSVNS